MLAGHLSRTASSQSGLECTFQPVLAGHLSRTASSQSGLECTFQPVLAGHLSRTASSQSGLECTFQPVLAGHLSRTASSQSGLECTFQPVLAGHELAVCCESQNNFFLILCPNDSMWAVSHACHMHVPTCSFTCTCTCMYIRRHDIDLSLDPSADISEGRCMMF